MDVTIDMVLQPIGQTEESWGLFCESRRVLPEQGMSEMDTNEQVRFLR